MNNNNGRVMSIVKGMDNLLLRNAREESNHVRSRIIKNTTGSIRKKKFKKTCCKPAAKEIYLFIYLFILLIPHFLCLKFQTKSQYAQ
jgi:hypothetical protein